MKRQIIKERLMTKTRAALRRGGFTLVELMVSIGLTLFIMVIIVEAFTMSMDSFQGFRAVGELTTQVRGALYLMRTDLAQSHLEASRRTSDLGFWESPRREGFFVVRQGSTPSTTSATYRDEGVDLDGVNRSYIATDHVLHFANRLRGNRRDQFVIENVRSQTSTLATSQTMVPNLLRETNYIASTDGGLTSSQWSEVAYFLRPMVNQSGAPVMIAEPNASGQPITLYNLYRTQLLVFPYTDTINTLYNYDAAVPTGAFNNVKMYSRAAAAGPNNKVQFYSPNDLAKGATTRSLDPAVPDITRASLVATNVVSFQVRIIKIGDFGFEDLPGPFPATFDTAVPQNYRLGGVQVILRLFDPSTGLTRQGTLIQDL